MIFSLPFVISQEAGMRFAGVEVIFKWISKYCCRGIGSSSTRGLWYRCL